MSCLTRVHDICYVHGVVNMLAIVNMKALGGAAVCKNPPNCTGNCYEY